MFQRLLASFKRVAGLGTGEMGLVPDIHKAQSSVAGGLDPRLGITTTYSGCPRFTPPAIVPEPAADASG